MIVALRVLVTGLGLLAVFLAEARAAKTVEVKTSKGILVGQTAVSVDGITYNAFRGVRYALSPVGPLRFKNPRPVAAWKGRQQATVEGASCPQWVDNGVQGNEDCLNLNVYSRRLGAAARQPVMVFIFGGAYQVGTASAKETGPDFLVAHDVVVVTVNYRLNAFGFLNLDNDDAPGNMGLKDQRAALQWVRDNIAAFGGDPKKVTIFGESSGASAVHYQTLVKASSGLFKQAILESGNALEVSFYTEQNLEIAAKLGKLLGSKSSSPRDIIASLRKSSTTQIITAIRSVKHTGPTFVPSPERRNRGSEEKFLTRDPESLVRNREVAPVPMIVGINNNETVSFFYAMKFDKNPTLMTQYNNNPAVLIPTNVAPSTDTARLLGVKTNRKLTASQEADFNKRIKQSYKLTGKGDDNFIQYYNDVRFGLAFHRLITLTLANPASRKLPLYLYEFDEDAPYNWGKNRYNIGPQGLGAAHQDELGYLLHITSPSDLKQTSKGNSPASKTLSLMTKLWTDFAKSGRPAAAKQWPAASGTAYTAPYAKISAKSWGHVGRGLRGQRMKVWEDVFDILRRK